MEESWRELLLKMKVSEVAKKYILSIDEEAKEYFEKTLSLIQDRIKKEVLSAPLVSSYITIRNIIEKEMTDFVETIVSLMDYYTEGVYFSGKLVSRKKLKLGKPSSVAGEKYSFTHNDRNFIELYKSNSLKRFAIQFDKAIVGYLVDKITHKKIQGQWNLDGDEDYKYFEYKKQEMLEEDATDLMRIISDSFSDVFDEFMDAVAREIIQLFRRAQIEEYKNLGIDAVVFISEDESLCCPVCNARSGKIMNLSDSLYHYGIKGGTNHSFCKFSVDPVISYKNQLTATLTAFSEFGPHVEHRHYVDNNSMFLSKDIKAYLDFNIVNFEFTRVPVEIEYRISKLIKKIQMYAKQFMGDTKFVFVDNITDLDAWMESVKTHYLEKGKNEFEANNEAHIAQDKFKFKVACFNVGDTYYISPMSFDSQQIESVLLRKIIGDKIEVDDWVKNRYDEKQNSKYVGIGLAVFKDPYISYLAQESAEEYLIESIVAYVNQPKKLKTIDEKMFNYIKENVFNSIEFF